MSQRWKLLLSYSMVFLFLIFTSSSIIIKTHYINIILLVIIFFLFFMNSYFMKVCLKDLCGSFRWITIILFQITCKRQCWFENKSYYFLGGGRDQNSNHKGCHLIQILRKVTCPNHFPNGFVKIKMNHCKQIKVLPFSC